MRVRLDKYQAASARMQWRSILLIGGGAVGIVLGSFFSLLGVLLLLMPDGEGGGLWARRAGLTVGLLGGVLPLGFGAVFVWRGIAARGAFRGVRELGAFARMTSVFTSSDVAAALGLGPRDAERLVLDAAALGILEDDGAIVRAPPTLPSRASPPSPHSAPHNAPDSWIGATLNDTYRVEELLGKGGMGVVYAARHMRTGRRYAVKTLHADANLSADAIKRFEREATAASALGHPNIIGVHDFHETPDGVHYMVMDLLEGETLERRLSRVGWLTWREALALALDLGSALTAAHDRGLLHRDLKPANVFLARSGPGDRAVLLDFGVVKRMNEAALSKLTETGAPIGTPLYMSPEQARGEELDARSDVYGLGAVVFEMVTGAPPFFDRTLANVYARLLTTAAPPASSLAKAPLPPALDAVLARALAKSKAERWPDMRAFVSALAQARGGS
jgi:tRNA A-37 threonylcarbamoyl transferase component Bud32